MGSSYVAVLNFNSLVAEDIQWLTNLEVLILSNNLLRVSVFKFFNYMEIHNSVMTVHSWTQDKSTKLGKKYWPLGGVGYSLLVPSFQNVWRDQCHLTSVDRKSL